MKKLLLSLCTLLSFSSFLSGQELLIPFEQSNGKETATYEEAIAFYQQLDDQYAQVRMVEAGISDAGKPIHLVLISREGLSSPVELGDRLFLLINNAIHPGEPCGVDASMMLARDLVRDPEMKAYLDHVVIGIIPAYNIGGMLNRGCCSRANQDGPAAYGFRGNARNYDLNRDFIKADTRNAKSFAEIFHRWLPDLFVDTHTTNGADYQADLTLIPTQQDKLQPDVAAYMQENLVPGLIEQMGNMNIPVCPYVNSVGRTPDQGIADFLDLPRYSSGYAALFQTMSFITEAHMLKAFDARVRATYVFLALLIQKANQDYERITSLVDAARRFDQEAEDFPVRWVLDKNDTTHLLFAGYEATYLESELTGGQRLFYDRSKPYKKYIPFYQHYLPTDFVSVPEAYIIPQAYTEVIAQLKRNGVLMESLNEDIRLEVEVSYMDEVKSMGRPYEGHFYHTEVNPRLDTQAIQFYAGDQVIWMDQIRNRFISHVLEPVAQDSYFRWNYFDGVLMRKEYFSPYVFEDAAVEMLGENPGLREAFEEKKATDSTFVKNPYAQLNFIYQRSPYAEPTYLRYPVARWWGKRNLPTR